MSTAEPSYDLGPALPPWDMSGVAWIFPIYTPFSETPVPLPAGSYAPLEQDGPGDQSSRFHGGVGTVFIIRYDASAVGPYDELIYAPGLFSRTKTGDDKPTYDMSITRIYVSADASTINGRKNWSIPKHRAIFTWTDAPNGGTLVSVSHSSSPSSPFFRAILRNSALTPFSIPISTSMLQWRLSKALMHGYQAKLYQPPLSGAFEVSEDKREEAKKAGQNPDALVGNKNAYTLEPTAKAWSRIVLIEVAPAEKGKEVLTGFGDGVRFPEFKVAVEGPLKGRGVHLTSMKMNFPHGVVVQD
ncbi:hypothetical protein JCM8547_003147 [Rhodosporidiobolus lusitaniae]